MGPAQETGRLEWFGSPLDLCRAHAELRALTDPRIAEIMSAHDGELGLGWPSVWFKGGTEPGVLARSYSVLRPDGTIGFAVAMTADQRATGELVALAKAGLTLKR